MFDLIKIFISFVLTGCVGVYISYRIQKKNTHNQLRLKKAEKKADELKNTRDRFEQLSGERIYRTRGIIASIKEGTVTEKEKIDYQESVINWNKNLNTIFFDLGNQRLYRIAIIIENKVHYELANAHLEIKRETTKKIGSQKPDLLLAEGYVNSAYASARDVTKSLTKIADERWDEIQNADSVPLSYWNAHQASTLTLIVALFHKAPHRLRVSRSRIDK